MATMIALIGEQQLPNFLPVLHYTPAHVLLVYTARTESRYKKLKAVLEQKQVKTPGKETGQKIKVFGVKTDPYNIADIIEDINKELAQNTELAQAIQKSIQPPVINWTGGTKVMSLAAYHIAQQYCAPMMYLQSEGKNSCMYHYNWKDQHLQSAGSELLPEYLTLQDVFDLHFGSGNWHENGVGRDEGSPFEEALASVLHMHGYEIMIGVGAMGGQIDVDVAIRAGNQYGIIEAKMGRNGRKLDGIKQLSTAARLLGTYSQTFYVITVPPQRTHRAITEASNIQVVSLPGYDMTTNMLQPLDVAELLSSVGNKLIA